MDGGDRYGDYGSTLGTTSYGQSDYYRQSYGHRSEHDEGSREWGYVAAGAVLLALGGYLLYQGARSQPAGMPFMGGERHSGGQGSGRLREYGERARSRAGGMLKGSRETPGIQVREQITVNRSVGELYRFWRNLENLPRVMSYVEEVRVTGDRSSHWVARGPAGQRVEWDAEITDARENELVAWRSLEGSDVPNEGSVRFSRSSDGTGTVIDVSLTYHPPGGKAGAAVAKLFGREPAQEIRSDLRRFKERVESGEIALSSRGGSYTGA